MPEISGVDPSVTVVLQDIGRCQVFFVADGQKKADIGQGILKRQ